MRRCLCALMLSCILGFGSLTANELTAAQAQQIISAAKSAQPGAPVTVTLTVAGKSVEFTVTRDALGSVTATPVPGPDSAGITIGSIAIQLKADSKGLLTPESLVVVTTSKATVKYEIKLTADGAVAELTPPGGGGSGGSKTDSTKVVGGIGGGSGELRKKDDPLKKDEFPGFTSGQLGLPAGTASGAASSSIP